MKIAFIQKTTKKKGKEPVLWIRIKDLGEKLDAKNVFDLVDKEIKGKFKDSYPTKQQIKKYKRHGSEFAKDVKFVYPHENVVTPIIMGNISPKGIEFRSRLGFNQYDITLKKESSVLKSIMDAFEGENMQTQYSVLSCKTDLYFHDHKLVVEIDEKIHKDRSIDYGIKRQKAIEKELNCKFVRIDPDKENFNIFKAQNKIFRHIKEANKKLTKNKMIDDAEKLTKNGMIDDAEKLTKMLKLL